MSNPLLEVKKYSQSIWYDNIQRSLLGKIKEMIDLGEIVGITSNPTIFDKAIGGSNDYDTQIANFIQNNSKISTYELYENLVVEDIRQAADFLKNVYESSDKLDGYVSIEVSPELANDTEKTVKEGLHLFSKIDRPNVMIKVPATSAGLSAITQLIAKGINVNVTLMFSQQDFSDVSNAYLSGLEKYADSHDDLSNIASVASFFISRMDAAADALLPSDSSLGGKVAINYAKNVYQDFLKLYNEERFLKLKEKGARIQRLLWASTGVKNPEYRDVLYVEELMGKNTVNTVPPHTLDAFRDHGIAQDRVNKNIEEITDVLQKVKNNNVDLEKIAVELKEKGVEAFQKSFQSLLKTLEDKRNKMEQKKN